MREPDFSGIDPLRVPEARRRVQALDKYLALPSPTTDDAIRLSGTIGLSRWQFQRLARVWREHRDPGLLVVGRRGASTRNYGMDPRAVQIAREEIDRAATDAGLSTVAPLVEARCRELGVTPPSRPTMWNYIRAAKSKETMPSEGPPRIIIGRMWFHLPVTLPDGSKGADMPTLLVAVALPERVIVSHAVSVDDEAPPFVADLVADLLAHRSPGAQSRPLLLEADDRRAAARALAAEGLTGLRSHDRSVQRELSRAFGGRLGPLPAVYRRAAARPRTKRIVQRQDERLAPTAAIAAIAQAVADSNTDMMVEPVAFDVTGSTTKPDAG